jgi:aldehyde dehydrogenase (NAD+)
LALKSKMNEVIAIAKAVAEKTKDGDPRAADTNIGPVISIIGFKDEDEAVRIANDTPYGLAGYVSAGSIERARSVARRLRAGNVNLNGVPNERTAPFGGYKQSGNGREWGRFGLEEYLEVKAIAGFGAN